MSADSSKPATIVPVPNELTRFYWEGAKTRKLMLLRCQRCRHFLHPPRVVCRHCLSDHLEPEQISGEATLYAWTVNVFPAERIVASVEIPEEPHLKIISNVINCEEDDMVAGMPLKVSFLDVTEGVTLPVFEPAHISSAPNRYDGEVPGDEA